jgi:lipid-binding SYLF domain-containing protein
MNNRLLAILLTDAIAIPIIANAGDDKTKTTSSDKTMTQTNNSEGAKDVAKATEVISDFATMKEGPPAGLVDKASAVVIIPNLTKVAFMAGGKHGEGFLTKRDASGNWSEPVAINLSGGSFGFQAGVSSTDLVLLLMRERDIDQVLDGEFTLGGEATVAAGPLGRDASAGTDVHFDAPIYSYSRSKGVFAGVAIDGSKLYLDKSENKKLYGDAFDAHATIGKTPAAGSPGAQLAQALNSLVGKTEASVGSGSSGLK